MNLADQAAYAIVIAARHFGVDPLEVCGDQIGTSRIPYIRARNTAGALLAGLPDFDRPMACRALGISASLADFLARFQDQASEGRLKWLSSAEFDRLRASLRAKLAEADRSPGFRTSREPEEFSGSRDRTTPKAAQRPAVAEIEPSVGSGLLDILYGIEETTG